MELGISGSLDQADCMQAAGADYIEVNIQKVFVPTEGEAAWEEQLAAISRLPLPLATAAMFLPGSLPSTGPDVDLDAILAYSQRAFRRAAQIGCKILVFGSGGSRRLREGEDPATMTPPFIELLKAIAPIAEGHGVTLVLEPLNQRECNYILSVPEAAAIVRAVDHPNLRLLADIYHMTREGQGPDDLRGHVELIQHVHVAESERTPPGVAGDDFRPFLQVLAEEGYTGRISIECKWEDFATQAAPALRALRSQVADVVPAGSR